MVGHRGRRGESLRYVICDSNLRLFLTIWEVKMVPRRAVGWEGSGSRNAPGGRVVRLELHFFRIYEIFGAFLGPLGFQRGSPNQSFWHQI